jgi:hypothetical protein
MAFEPLKKIYVPRVQNLDDARKAIEEITARTNQIIEQFKALPTGGGGGVAGVSSFKTRTGDVVPATGDYTAAQVGAVPTSHLGDADPHTQYQKESEKGAANGYASLDSGGLVPTSQLPGATTTFTYYDPDKPPTSPSSLDDEFDGSSIDAKWTQVNFGSVAAFNVNNTKPSGLWAKPGAAAGGLFLGLVQAIPAGDFTLVAKITHSASLGWAGLLLTDNNTGSAGNQATALFYRSSGLQFRAVYRHTSWSAFSAILLGDIVHPNFGYIRWRRSGTSYFAAWSVDGRSWADNAITLGFTPTFLGIVFNAGGSGETEVSYDWVRYAASSTALFGGLRTVTGS